MFISLAARIAWVASVCLFAAAWITRIRSLAARVASVCFTAAWIAWIGSLPAWIARVDDMARFAGHRIRQGYRCYQKKRRQKNSYMFCVHQTIPSNIFCSYACFLHPDW